MRCLLFISLFCALALLPSVSYAQVPTYVVFENGVALAKSNGVQASLTAAGATLTVVTGDVACGGSALLVPVDPVAFPVYMYYVQINSWSSCSAAELTALETTINAYVSAGGVFIYSGYDSARTQWVNIMGATGFSDRFGSNSINTPVYSTDPICDILLDGVGGTLTTVNMPVRDYDTFNDGTSTKCMTDATGGPTRGFWTVFPNGSGYAIYLTDGDSSSTTFNSGFDTDIAVANIIGFAASLIGGDPHIRGFDGSLSDLSLQSGSVVNLLSSPRLQVNARVLQAPLREQVSYLNEIAVQVRGSQWRVLIDAGARESQSQSATVHLSVPATDKDVDEQDFVDLSHGGEFHLITSTTTSVRGANEQTQCRLKTVTKDSEEFDEMAIPNSPFKQSPVLRANLRCHGMEITFEIHEFRHSIRAMEHRSDFVWVEYLPGTLAPVARDAVIESEWIERRIDMYTHEVVGADLGEEMSGVLGSTRGRRRRIAQQRGGERQLKESEGEEVVERFLVESNDLFGSDFTGNLFDPSHIN